MKLTIVRHGQTEENLNRIVQGQLPGKLTPLGIEQAQKAAEVLSSESFDQIWSSDLARCVDTAQVIAGRHPDLELQLTPAIREYNFGTHQGKPSAELDWTKQIGTGIDRRCPDGECARDVALRISQFLNQVREQDPQHVLLVTHGGPIRIMKALVRDEPLSKQFETELPNTTIVELELGSPLDYTTLYW